jgi:hypothetical protein
MNPSASSIANDAIASILDNPAFQALWKRHYASRGIAPLADLAKEFRAVSGRLEARPDLVSFAKTFIDLETKALGRVWADEKEAVTKIRTKLKDIGDCLSVAEAKITDTQPELSVTMNSILEMVKKETAQIPFTPLQSAKGIFKNWFNDLCEDIKKHPISSAVWLPTIGYSVWWISDKVSRTKIRFKKEETGLTGFMPDEDFFINPNLVHEIQQPCHYDVSFKVAGHQISIPIPDCTAMNNFADGALNVADKTLGFFNVFSERLRHVTEDPVSTLGHVMPPHLMQVFNEAVHQAGNYVVVFDQWENMLIHTFFLGWQWYAAHKKTQDSSSLKESLNKIGDFLVRNVKVNPLVCTGAAAALINDPHLSAFWPVVGGAIAGHCTQEIGRVLTRRGHVENIMEPHVPLTLGEKFKKAAGIAKSTICADFKPVREVLPDVESCKMVFGRAATVTKEKLHDARNYLKNIPGRFSEAAEKTISIAKSAGQCDFQPLREALPTPKTCAKAFASVAAVTLVGIVGADAYQMIENETLKSVSTGTVKGAGYGLVTGMYGIWNTPQDLLVHVPYLLAGRGLGFTTRHTKTYLQNWRSEP